MGNRIFVKRPAPIQIEGWQVHHDFCWREEELCVGVGCPTMFEMSDSSNLSCKERCVIFPFVKGFKRFITISSQYFYSTPRIDKK